MLYSNLLSSTCGNNAYSRIFYFYILCYHKN
nr:MAG TPA: hypothetical protein [Caudoviricetes sp.]DAW40376.1 MAG TPA: hypothetical protein [Caudoviricetes sp.]